VGAMLAVLFLRAAAAAAVETGEVVAVADGDTITVRIGPVKEKIRLIGIDTPELKDTRPAWRRLAFEAGGFVRERLLGRTVTLDADPLCANRDKYGRLLRYVALADGTDLNDELIRRGYARAYTRFPCTRAGRYKAAEREARTAGRGRWAPLP